MRDEQREGGGVEKDRENEESAMSECVYRAFNSHLSTTVPEPSQNYSFVWPKPKKNRPKSGKNRPKSQKCGWIWIQPFLTHRTVLGPSLNLFCVVFGMWPSLAVGSSGRYLLGQQTQSQSSLCKDPSARQADKWVTPLLSLPILVTLTRAEG